MKKVFIFLSILLLVLVFSFQANADLTVIGQAQYEGSNYNLIWDDDSPFGSIVWLDYTNSYDSWQNQVNWASGLNTSGVLTYNIDPAYSVTWSGDWRLPSTVDGQYYYGTNGTTTGGYNITSSEMGHLYYTELGNAGGYDTSGNWNGCTISPPSYCLTNTGPFLNLQTYTYWSGTEYSVYPNDAWAFYTNSGQQNDLPKYNTPYGLITAAAAIAVRPGDVTPADCRQAIGKLTVSGIINGEAFKSFKVPIQYMLCFNDDGTLKSYDLSINGIWAQDQKNVRIDFDNEYFKKAFGPIFESRYNGYSANVDMKRVYYEGRSKKNALIGKLYIKKGSISFFDDSKYNVGTFYAEGRIVIVPSTIRAISQGDKWNYKGGGKWDYGNKVIEFTGTGTRQILYSTKQSPITYDNCLDGYMVMNISTPAGVFVIGTHDYFLQDIGGSISTYGTDFGTGSGDVWVTSPFSGKYLTAESPMYVGQSNHYSLTYTDGTTMTISYLVEGVESVTTGVGKLMAYRVSENATIYYTNGTTAFENITNWIVANIGSVKMKSKTFLYSNGVFQLHQKLHYTLTSTSVVY